VVDPELVVGDVVVAAVVVAEVVVLALVGTVVPGALVVDVVVVEAPDVVEVVVLVVEVVLDAGRFGYTGLSQQALGSASGPLWGASSNVITIRPPSL